MNRSSLPISLKQLQKWYEAPEPTLRCTLPFQRHSGMWNTITKSNLAWAILADSYIPPIVLLKDKAGVDSRDKVVYSYQVLDGTQRLTSLFDFMNDGYALHSATSEVELDGVIYDLAGLKFSELSEECQDAIKNYRFSVQCLENYTLAEAEALFYNINSGVALSAVQKSKSKLGTALITQFNELLKGNFFTQAINITERQARAEDDLLMLLQIALLLDNKYDGREYKNISAATCLDYAAEIRNSYTSEKRERLESLVGYLDEVFNSKSKFLRRNNVAIVAVCAQIAKEYGIEPLSFKAFINDFSNGVYPAYEDASGSGNIKAIKVQMRLRVMWFAMCEYYGWNSLDISLPFSADIPLYVSEHSDSDSAETPSVTDGESADGNAGVVTDENAEVTENTLSSDGASEVEAETAGNEGEVQE